jgi:hypothetical protein
MEGIVRRVFADAGFRSRFLDNPELALAGADLSVTQRGALANLASQMRVGGGAEGPRGGDAGATALVWA